MINDERYEVGQNDVKRVIISNKDQLIRNETSKAIRKIMEVIEKYTDFHDLEDLQRDVVRDTILNQINSLSRVIKHKQTMIFQKSD